MGGEINAEVGMRNGVSGMRSGEGGTRKSEWGMGIDSGMRKDELRDRTKAFVLSVIRLADALPNRPVGRVIRDQILRCGTSVGANYRAAKRAKSAADFIHKMGIVEEEADESMYWMELIVEAGLLPESRISDLYQEADEILSMVVASIKTAKRTRK